MGPDANSDYFDLTTTVEYVSGRNGDVEPPPARAPSSRATTPDAVTR